MGDLMDWVIQICRAGGVWRAGEANRLEVSDPACLGRMPTDLARCRKDGWVLEVSIVATHPWTCLKSQDKGGQWPQCEVSGGVANQRRRFARGCDAPTARRADEVQDEGGGWR